MMWQSLTRLRNIENNYRIIPLLKRSFNTFESAIIESEEDHPKTYKDINRFRELKKYKKNFIENLFLGIFEPQALEYPQIRTKEEVDYLKEHEHQINNELIHKIDLNEIVREGVSKNILLLLQQNNLLGMKLKQEYNGLGYFESESTYIQESLSSCPSLCKTLAEHENCGYKILSMFGNKAQKDLYLPMFLNGNCVACLAHLENNSWVSHEEQEILLTTNATKQSDECYSITGKKTLIYNPNNADIIFVTASTDNNNNENYTVFMVDKNSPGLTVLDPLDTIGLKGLEICDIVLDNVIVPKDNIVGSVNKGSDIVNTLLSQGKMCNGAQCVGLMRDIINNIISHCIHKSHFKKPLYKYKYIQGIIGELVNTLYAAESMTYLKTGRFDESFDLNILLESVITKIFNSEALNFIAQNFIQLTGRVKSCDELTQTLVRDCYFFSALDDPNGYLKVLISSVGVKHVLAHMKSGTRLENYRPRSLLNLKLCERTRSQRLPDILKGYLHLTLKQESKILQSCVQNLNFFTENLIHHYGENLLMNTNELNLLSEIVIIIYKLTAVLGRASRSYCIGLRNAEIEILIARNIAQNSYQRVITIFDTLRNVKCNQNYREIGKQVSENRKYSIVHPVEPVGARECKR